MKKRWTLILLVFILAAGLLILLYPTLSDWWNSFHQSRVVSGYLEEVAALDKKEYEAIWKSARDFNRSLLKRTNRFLLTKEQEESYPKQLDVSGNGVMGYIEIPSIGIKLPICHGSGEKVLQNAVGHLEWSSLPVGGESTHCVLGGHRGLPSARLFTDLDKVRVGDTFFLRVLDEVLTYRVDQILVVLPSDTDALQIVEGEDFCTLFTCTPYGTNSHRLLVRGRRVETTESTAPAPGT